VAPFGAIVIPKENTCDSRIKNIGDSGNTLDIAHTSDCVQHGRCKFPRVAVTLSLTL
jgi:hypothetical protein